MLGQRIFRSPTSGKVAGADTSAHTFNAQQATYVTFSTNGNSGTVTIAAVGGAAGGGFILATTDRYRIEVADLSLLTYQFSNAADSLLWFVES